MPHPVDPDTFGFLITDLSRLIRAEVDRHINEAGIGLTPGEGRTLVHAARAGLVRQSVLAERIGFEPMTLSGYLDRLEARGLVERVPDPADRRAKLVKLTDAADHALEQIRTAAAAVRTDAAKNLSSEDWARLIEMLKATRANLSSTRREHIAKDQSDAA